MNNKLKEALKFTEGVFIPGLERILGKDAQWEGINIVRIDMPALVGERVRAYRLVRFIKSQRPRLLLLLLSTRIAELLMYFYDGNFTPKKFTPAKVAIPVNLPKILFVATMETHLKNLIPLMYEAVSRGVSAGLIVTSGFEDWSVSNSVPKEIKVFNFRDFVSQDDVDQYEREQGLYQALFDKHSGELKRLSEFNSINFWGAIGRGLREFFRFTLPANIMYLKIAKKILVSNPKAIIVSRVLKPSETALITHAHAQSTKTIGVIHGLIPDDPDYYYGNGRYDILTRVYVWNEAQKAQVIKQGKGIPEAVIEASPQWESMLKINAKKEDVLRKIGVREDKIQSFSRIITYCAGKSDDAEILKSISDAGKLSLTTLLLIKAHPTTSKEFLHQVLGTLPDNIMIVDHGLVPLVSILKISDLALTVTSTALFEALVVGTPMVLYRARSFTFVDELVNFGAPVVYDENGLRELFESSKTKADFLKDCAEFKKNYLGSTEQSIEGSSERIIDYALS